MIRLFCLCLLSLVLSACQTTEETHIRGGDEIRLIEAIPAARPDWLNATPQPDGRYYYFVGISENASMEAHAKDLAVADALKKAAAYSGVSISDKSERITESRFKTSETADPSISEMEKLLQSARAYFSRFHSDQFYVEHFGRMQKKQIMDSSFRASVLLSIPTDEVESAINESRKHHERSFDALWGDKYKAGVIIVNDGSSQEDFDLARSVLTEYFTQNKVLVVQNQSNPDPDHPLFGLKASFSDNEDVYGMKSVTGIFSVRMFFKDENGSDIVGETVVSTNAGAGVNSAAARKASVSKFIESHRSDLMKLVSK